MGAIASTLSIGIQIEATLRQASFPCIFHPLKASEQEMCPVVSTVCGVTYTIRCAGLGPEVETR